MEVLAPGTRVKYFKYGEGVISKVNLTTYTIFFATGGEVHISQDNDELEVLEAVEGNEAQAPRLSIEKIEEAIVHTLDKYGLFPEEVPMGSKWTGGKVILEPGNADLQPKEIEIDAFFRKIVMVRDRLRVLEQNINSHKSLSEEEKIHLQQYITRAYGSLTTFNVLFSEKEHYFKGAGK